MQVSESPKYGTPGPLIVVLGPSGSGKDTLMSYARGEFGDRSDVLFVKRAITRPADAGSEDHIAMTDAEFDAAIDEGRFSLTWAANGLRYGLPCAIGPHLAEGGLAVVNGSRGAWSIIRQVFPSAVAVEIKVDPDVLAQRLEARGRESASEIEARLQRALALETELEADVTIDNSGDIKTAASKLVAYMAQAISGSEAV